MIAAQRQVQGPGPADGEIVDRAADREPADVAAGKEQRVDHEAVGGDRQPVAVTHQLGEAGAGLILEGAEHRVVERAGEDVGDQIAHRLAATAMGERDRRHGDPDRRPARSRAHDARASRSLSRRSRSGLPYW